MGVCRRLTKGGSRGLPVSLSGNITDFLSSDLSHHWFPVCWHPSQDLKSVNDSKFSWSIVFSYLTRLLCRGVQYTWLTPRLENPFGLHDSLCSLMLNVCRFPPYLPCPYPLSPAREVRNKMCGYPCMSWQIHNLHPQSSCEYL